MWNSRLIRPAVVDSGSLRTRESWLVSIMLTLMSAFFTLAIPSALAYPKHGPEDWLVVYILIGMTCAGWLLALLSWWQIIRSRRTEG